MLLGEDLGVAEFDEEAGALGVEEFDLADKTAVVALSDEVLGLAGGGEGLGEGAGLFGAVSDLGEGGFDVADGSEDGLPVLRRRFGVGGPGVTDARTDHSVTRHG